MSLFVQPAIRSRGNHTLIPSFFSARRNSVFRSHPFTVCRRPAAQRQFEWPKNISTYTDAVRRVCEDIVFRLPVFAAIRMEHVAISLVRTRNREMHGVFASVTPLRFPGGNLRSLEGGTLLEMPTLNDEQNRPILYILSIYAPRFVNLTVTVKINTIVHELFHISPNFDGSTRSFGGRYHAHGASKKDYDAKVERYARQWLACDPAPELWDFLRYDFKTLCARYGGLTGTRVKVPPMKVIRSA